MLVAGLMKPEGRVFLKSVFGQIGDDWPCVSFSRASVGVMLRNEFEPGRDVMIYVGTQNKILTENPDHRARLIAAVVIEPKQVLETRKLVSAENWAKRAGRWPLSMAVLKAATLTGPPFPSAYDVIPAAYRSFGNVENRGEIIEAKGEERVAVMALSATVLELQLTQDVRDYIKLRKSYSAETPKGVNSESLRMAALIAQRVKGSGGGRYVSNPVRSAPNQSDLYALLTRKWQEDQGGLCALCGAELNAGTKNPLMQPSPDRIDSGNTCYAADNLQVTHLACNLAKNQFSVDKFEEWLNAVRGVSEPKAE